MKLVKCLSEIILYPMAKVELMKTDGEILVVMVILRG